MYNNKCFSVIQNPLFYIKMKDIHQIIVTSVIALWNKWSVIGARGVTEGALISTVTEYKEHRSFLLWLT